MAEFVDSTVKDIDSRLRELKEEVSKLEAARTALVGTRRGPGRPRGSRSTSRRPVVAPRAARAGPAAAVAATRVPTRRWNSFARSRGSRFRRSPRI